VGVLIKIEHKKTWVVLIIKIAVEPWSVLLCNIWIHTTPASPDLLLVRSTYPRTQSSLSNQEDIEMISFFVFIGQIQIHSNYDWMMNVQEFSNAYPRVNLHGDDRCTFSHARKCVRFSLQISMYYLLVEYVYYCCINAKLRSRRIAVSG
jgi:hypothetical protein